MNIMMLSIPVWSGNVSDMIPEQRDFFHWLSALIALPAAAYYARDYSEATAEQIDREVRKLIDDAYETARQTLMTHRDKLETIAKALLEYETLDGSQIKDIMEHGHMRNPPPGPPPSTGEKMKPEKPPKQVVIAPDVTPPLPGGLSGAPA